MRGSTEGPGWRCPLNTQIFAFHIPRHRRSRLSECVLQHLLGSSASGPTSLLILDTFKNKCARPPVFWRQLYAQNRLSGICVSARPNQGSPSSQPSEGPGRAAHPGLSVPVTGSFQSFASLRETSRITSFRQTGRNLQ